MLAAQGNTAVRSELLERVSDARRRSDALFDIVRPDSLYERPIPERHRIVFYVGHLEAFDWNLHENVLGLKSFHPEFDRLMHVETLAYMLHQLSLDRKVLPGSSVGLVTEPVTHRRVPIPAGAATLGLSRRGETFGWDNEFETHTTHVPAFEIDKYEVTNRQYLDFMAAGGYETRAFWSDDDWNWKAAHAVSNPVFWTKAPDGWLHRTLYRTMFEEVPLPLDWPVYVSHAEAMAYARWAGKWLPSEEQWHRAAYGTTDGIERQYPWGSQVPNSSLGNFDFSHWNPSPVNAFPDGHSAFGVHDMLGNGWEWTSTVFAPFPGFEPFPFYRGYSADFFDAKHFVMKGGSPRTAACMLRPTFRNWFQGHYQYAYAGFRCVNH
jgi:ergothioneine biosynthesis protein EgtB